MSSKEGEFEDNIDYLQAQGEDMDLRVDRRNNRVFFDGESVDPKEDKDFLVQIMEDKKDEREELKNIFLREFQMMDDEESEKVAMRLGKLSTDISAIEDILKR